MNSKPTHTDLVIYKSTIVKAGDVLAEVTVPRRYTKTKDLALDAAKVIAKKHRGAGIYDVSKGRFIGWVNLNGNFVRFR